MPRSAHELHRRIPGHVPIANEDAYRETAAQARVIYKEYGAVHYVECCSDDLSDGKHTDFKMAVKADPGETVVFEWIVWPSKEVRDRANQRMLTDPRMAAMEMPFDGKRMIFGGFVPLVDSAS